MAPKKERKKAGLPSLLGEIECLLARFYECVLNINSIISLQHFISSHQTLLAIY